MRRKIGLIGAAIDACGGTRGASDTPDILKEDMGRLGLLFEDIFYYKNGRHDIEELRKYFVNIAHSVKSIMQDKQFPIVVGGDHSCAIGTWSGVADELSCNSQTLGMIWCDAHMDAHTPETSPSGNIHGMPVATLLGYGYKDLINIINDNPKIKPENIILIGIRSFEYGEEELLKQLGVQIYYNYDITKRGFNVVFNEAYSKLSTTVDKIGLSIDLDGFDPEFAPGVGTKEPDGINFNEFIESLKLIDIKKIVALEITEGNSHFDPSGKTMRCITDIVSQVKDLEYA